MAERTVTGLSTEVVDDDLDLGLPDRKYFKIGEVAALLGVEPHVLRYWETQFSQIKPHKARSGHRLYRRRDVETLIVIKDLMHVQRFTLAGARQALRTQGTTSLLPRAAEQLTLPPTSSLQARHTRVVESTIPTVVEADDDDSLDTDDDVDDDGDDDDDDDVVEFHLADPLPRAGEVEVLIEARDGAELEDALAEQLTHQLTKRAVVAVEVSAAAPAVLNRAAAVVALQAVSGDLQSLIGRLRQR
jgi:DNA-binding transcriptional MerR regulator